MQATEIESMEHIFGIFRRFLVIDLIKNVIHEYTD